MDTCCAPLVLRSNYSLLCGATPLERLVERAKRLGYDDVALADINNLYGAVRFYNLAREAGLKPILGCDLRRDGDRAILLARDREGYSGLCRVLSRRMLDDTFDMAEVVERFQEGLHVLTDQPGLAARLANRMDRGRLWMWAGAPAGADAACAQAAELGIGAAASPDVFFADIEDWPVHRVLTAIRLNTTVSRLAPADVAPRHAFLPPPAEAERVFRPWPEALANSGRIAGDCHLELTLGKPIFPRFQLRESETALGRLAELCRQGMDWRYGRAPASRQAEARQRLGHELNIIERLGFTEYFLFVWDILEFARERHIPTIGRGSGASSIVSYLLGLTSIDPIEFHIPFERFLHLERKDCPDLDIDLCWERRDHLIESVYRKYGLGRVAMVSTHSTLQFRSAFREVARAHGLANDTVSRLCARMGEEWEDGASSVAPAGLSAETLRVVLAAAERLRGFPRHLSVHCGGLVIGDKTLDHYVPLEMSAKGVVVTQFEKDAVEAIGLVKMDFLGNHGLTIRDEALRLAAQAGKQPPAPEDVPDADPATAALLRAGQTLGCCQLESPAMRNLLRMLRAGSVKDLMQALALVRPGPASLGSKEEFVRRARGLAPATLPHPSLEYALGGSLGMMLYEDDAMLVAVALTGVSADQGDLLRKAIKKARTKEKLREVSERFLGQAEANGVARSTAAEMWAHMAKFTSYSFCKAHAASYGLLAWQIAFLKAHYPLEFMASALNHQWGMYPRRVHVEEARRLGVGVWGPDVNRSQRRFAIEDGGIRVGLEQVKGLSSATIDAALSRRRERLFASATDFTERTGAGVEEVEALVLCGAFDFTGRNRPQLIWEARTAKRPARAAGGQGGLFAAPPPPPAPSLPDFPLAQKLSYELESMELAATCHPLTLFRQRLSEAGFADSRAIAGRSGAIRIAGILDAERETQTQRDESMQFLTMEDEYGVFEVTVFSDVFRRCRHAITDAGPYLVWGAVERQYDAVTVNARRVERAEALG